MDFPKIPGRKLSVRVRAVEDGVILRSADVLDVGCIDSIEGEYTLRTKDEIYVVRPCNKESCKQIEDEILSGAPSLKRLCMARPDGSATFEAAIFDGRKENYGSVEIGVDETIVEYVRKSLGHTVKAESLCESLKYDFVYERDDGQTFFFIITGPALERDLLAEDLKIPDKIKIGRHAPKAYPNGANSFKVLGDQATFVACETEVTPGRSIYLMTKYNQRKNRAVNDRSVRLTLGVLNFANWTEAGEVSRIVKSQLLKSKENDNSYFHKWDKFGNMEGELLLDKARRAGVLRYHDFHETSDDGIPLIKVDLDHEAPEEWNYVTSIELVNEDLPAYLEYADLTFEAFVKKILPEGADFDKETKRRANPNPIFELEAVTMDRKALYIRKAESLPTKSGRFIMSLVGDMTQIKRREEARRRIYEGRSANPALKLIIEEGGNPPMRRSPRKIEALTPFVRRKIFPKHDPTPKQEAAIRIALNTPDIALIQGPPGTGKTTVIAAILERLNEDADKRHVNAGSVLLTGFQHDAVENLIDRVKINSLPVRKFGNRPNGGENEEDRYVLKIESWCHEIAEKIRAKYPDLRKTEDETFLDNLCLQYATQPSATIADRIIDFAAAEGSPVDNDVRARAKKMLDSVKRRNIDEMRKAEVVRCIRNLRISREGFMDDGPDRAIELQLALEEVEGCPIFRGMDALEEATLMVGGEEPDDALLDKLYDLKCLLMLHFVPPPTFRREKRNAEVARLAADVRESIGAHRQKNAGSIEFAFARFLSVLERNPTAVMNTLSDYSFAYAATCQFSSSDKMRRVKIQTAGEGDDSPDVEYDYVIVDEAARVGPLDLRIALSQGKKIILVGDHRQLPHIVNEEVSRKLETGAKIGENEELDWLNKSMFYYLFHKRILELEARDNIPRHITLDMQYRMHPVLGDFISKNFYEHFDPTEHFGSGLNDQWRRLYGCEPPLDGDSRWVELLKAEKLFHSLPGTDSSPVVWLDVPEDLGGYDRARSGSLYRDVEARAIRKYYSLWSTSPQGQDLSYGIISFYKEQVNKIRRQIGGGENSEKLRIGTVDSFQGMEFDVVFLSLVRTSRKSRQDENIAEKAARIYGFLSLYNRLNVSMSRQKKLLVLVGDAGLTRAPFAEKYIPGLVNFRKLCEEKNKVISYVS